MPVPHGPPRDASLDGHLVDGAFRYLTLTTGICFAIVVVVMAATLIFHRSRGARAAHYTHGDRRRDHILTLGVAIAMLVGIDAVLAGRSLGELETRFWKYPDADPAAVRVEVTARQWSWTFRLAGPDGVFGTRDDVVSLGELHVPAGRPIYLKLRSKDVIHSLYLPAFRTKIDAVPGQTTRLWFQAREPGRYELGCAQHCGVSHYKMRGEMLATPEAEWQAWVTRAVEDGRLRYDASPDQAAGAWDWDQG
ncbi:MAG TPA: cytochrome C oxidase subunit II [Polyangia bacterium]|nr:cytochrome C oxidase subunit II [Polyangia bacterium]